MTASGDINPFKYLERAIAQAEGFPIRRQRPCASTGADAGQVGDEPPARLSRTLNERGPPETIEA